MGKKDRIITTGGETERGTGERREKREGKKYEAARRVQEERTLSRYLLARHLTPSLSFPYSCRQRHRGFDFAARASRSASKLRWRSNKLECMAEAARRAAAPSRARSRPSSRHASNKYTTW